MLDISNHGTIRRINTDTEECILLMPINEEEIKLLITVHSYYKNESISLLLNKSEVQKIAEELTHFAEHGKTKAED